MAEQNPRSGPGTFGRGPASPAPAGLVAAFAARFGLPMAALAARLQVPADTLSGYNRDGGPGWLRLALVGIAVELGAEPDGLWWLLRSDPHRAATDAGDQPGPILG